MKMKCKALWSLCLCLVLLVSAALPAFAALGTVKTLAVSDTTLSSVTLKWSAVSVMNCSS